MCGIAGATRNLLGANPEKTLGRMNVEVNHRGPDMNGVFWDSHMGLCHTRLSIIDLSPDGKQPMSTVDSRYTITFNGEIYNFLELREELISEGYQFRTKTDTEVLLYLYDHYGPASVDKIRGMFAYAIWDSREKKLFAARDRIGKKPLHYFFCNGEFAFASEIKSLLQLEGIPREIDRTAIIDYMKYLFIPHPKTIYRSIQKLEPGYFLLYQDGRLEIRKYWDVDFSDCSQSNTEGLSYELLRELEGAVGCRLISDVPLGAFLSGGVDSSGVVALMAKASNGPVTTCSIGFGDKEHDEAVFAKRFAAEIGTNHHDYYVDNEPANILKKLVWHFDEPFADSSMVPTYYVSNLARRSVTVALTGDGGDESFAGYDKYVLDGYENLARRLAPHNLLSAIERATNGFYTGTLKRLNSLSRSAGLPPASAFYETNTFVSDRQLQALMSDELSKTSAAYDPSCHIKRYFASSNGPDHLSNLLYTDLKLYLPGDILVKVDRMSMANSLEVRSPLLDHKVIELAARIPSSAKLRGREKKFILKRALAKVLPSDVLKRPKHGFTVPLDRWFRDELREMNESTVFGSKNMPEFFRMESMRSLWNQHLAGKANHGTILWSLLVFALWLDLYSN